MLESLLNNRLLKLRNRHFLFFDLIFLLISPLLALVLRLDGKVDFSFYIIPIFWCTLVFLFIDIIVFYKLGLYNRDWSNASIDELAKLIFIIFWAVIVQTGVSLS